MDFAKLLFTNFNCFTFVASVSFSPPATLMIRRSEPTLPTATTPFATLLFCWLVKAEKLLTKAPLTSVPVPNAKELLDSATAFVPIAMELVPVTVAPRPIAVVLVLFAFASLPIAMAPSLEAFAAPPSASASAPKDFALPPNAMELDNFA